MVTALSIACAGAAGVALDNEPSSASSATAILGPEPVFSWTPERVLEARPPLAWRRVRGPIGTVCVTGDDRIGKSTLLTLWARNLTGHEGNTFAFQAGHTLKSQTQGMWSAMVPREASGLQYHLNLCDSQGLKQVEEVEQRRLFSANVLTPQVLVYMLINVFQNDQIRDLAEMAHQFQELSADNAEDFGRLLSPHLIVVVRDESDLGGSENLSAHIERVLRSPGFAEDKALIRRVFRTREALPLLELPTDARRIVRERFRGTVQVAGPSAVEGVSSGVRAIDDAGGEDLPFGAEPWRQSGVAVLYRALAALDDKLDMLPRGGPELSEWHRSVAQTVNSQEVSSLGRLIGHSDRLARNKQRRRFLQVWSVRALLALVICAIALALGGCLGRWLDRTAWCAWLLICVLYVGTSQLVTSPLQDLIAVGYCDSLSFGDGVGAGGLAEGGLKSTWGADALLRSACREATPHTAAVVLAVTLGILSYPLATSQLRALARRLPGVPRQLGAPVALVGLVVSSKAIGIWESDDAPDRDASMEHATLAAYAVLAVVVVVSAVQLLMAVNHNHLRAQARSGIHEVHRITSARIDEVRELEQSIAWKEHYRRHSAGDALWRFRRMPTWRPAALCGQACALLAWAWLISPSCDILLASGAAANLLGLLWHGGSIALSYLPCFRCCLRGRRRDTVAQWLDSLEDASSDEGDTDGAASSAGVPKPPPLTLPESEEEVNRRRSLDSLRLAESRLATRAVWWEAEQ